MNDPGTMESRDWWLRIVALLGSSLLLLGIYFVLSPFLAPIAWGAVIASVTWPLYKKVRSLLWGRETLSTIVMLSGVIILMILPVTFLVLASADEATRVYTRARQFIEQGSFIDMDYPWLTAWIEWFREKTPFEEIDIRKHLLEWAGFVPDILIKTGQDLVSNIFKVFITLFILFFMYRDGERSFLFFKKILPISGAYGDRLISHVERVVKAVVYGIFSTAIAQGTLAGVGYWFLGFEAPILMGMISAVLALLPFGTVLLWLPAAIWLFVEGSLLKGIILLIWGAGVVGTIDNLFRPILVSYTGKISALLVFLGTIGGFMAFGMIGLFIGPILLSLGQVLLKEYVGEEGAEATVD